jgi:cell division transport system permease protein
MKLVGATPSYIVMPFVVEALIVGFLSAVIAFIFVIFGTNYAIKLILPREILEELSFLVKGLSLGSAKIFGLQVLLGVSIGVICSLIGVKRYLKS